MSNTINTIANLKAKWITNYIPTQSDFSDLFTTLIANTSGSGDVIITSATGLGKINGNTIITDNLTASLSIATASYSLVSTSSSYSDNSNTSSYSLSLPFNFYDNETPSGSVDGINDTFTLLNIPISNSLHLYSNGSRQAPITDYTLSTNTIIFTPSSIPISESILLADYKA